jgi:hypothetical protein
MLIAFHVGELLVPSHQEELLGLLRPEPPMICFAFKVKAVVAAIRALNFHTSITSFQGMVRVSAPLV